VVITNSGDLELAMAASVDDEAFRVQLCPSLPPASSCTAVITFTPTSLGTYGATATITGANPLEGITSTLDMHGVGLAPLARATTALAFPPTSINTFSKMGLTIANAGNADLHIMKMSLSGDAAVFSAEGCTGPISADTTCMAWIRYAPTQPGSNSALLTIATDGGVLSVVLNGNTF
jgi:hypothetical protein